VKGDELQRQSGAIAIHPFDDPLVIAGQGTIGEELLRQSERDLTAVFVAVGGGGLISGIASYIKALRPDVQIIGVEPFEAALGLRARSRWARGVGGFGQPGLLRHATVEGISCPGAALVEQHDVPAPEHFAEGG